MSEEKEKFGVKMETQLKEWQARIEESKKAAEAKGSEFLNKYNAEFEKVGKLYEDARYRLKLLRMSSGDAWGEMKVGLEKAFGELKKAAQNAFEKF